MAILDFSHMSVQGFMHGIATRCSKSVSEDILQEKSLILTFPHSMVKTQRLVRIVLSIFMRMFIDQAGLPHRFGHMAIHPYPTELTCKSQHADGREIIIRPIRPEDANIEQNFVTGLSSQSRYYRFMQSFEKLTSLMLARFTQIDYDREMALIAVINDILPMRLKLPWHGMSSTRAGNHASLP